jgi:tRNA A37 threonylcarbamoyltransferase TsaD
VAANKKLGRMLQLACERHGARLFACPIEFAGDNGAQISWTALRQYRAEKKQVSIEKSYVSQSWRLDTVDISWRRP